jgi:hypothetical protein
MVIAPMLEQFTRAYRDVVLEIAHAARADESPMHQLSIRFGT